MQVMHPWKGSVTTWYSRDIGDWDGQGYGAWLHVSNPHPGAPPFESRCCILMVHFVLDSDVRCRSHRRCMFCPHVGQASGPDCRCFKRRATSLQKGPKFPSTVQEFKQSTQPLLWLLSSLLHEAQLGMDKSHLRRDAAALGLKASARASGSNAKMCCWGRVQRQFSPQALLRCLAHSA